MRTTLFLFQCSCLGKQINWRIEWQNKNLSKYHYHVTNQFLRDETWRGMESADFNILVTCMCTLQWKNHVWAFISQGEARDALVAELCSEIEKSSFATFHVGVARR